MGPTKRSNWIVPGRILAGDRTAVDTADGLEALINDARVDTFVCLQTKAELSTLTSYEANARRLIEQRAPEQTRGGGGVWFRHQPIPDQDVTGDELVEELIDDLVLRLASGRTLYIHCRGGHGRTGTICSLLLARIYGLSAAEALARYQWYHDMRKQPVFAAEAYELSLNSHDGSSGDSCVALFQEQRQQVKRLVRSWETPPKARAADTAAAAATLGRPDAHEDVLGVEEEAVAPAVTRGLSSQYGAGASKYEEVTLLGWESVGKQAAAAVRSRDWAEAEAHTMATIKARPDWHKGYTCLSMIRSRRGDAEGAMAAISEGLGKCTTETAHTELRDAMVRLLAVPTAPKVESDTTAARDLLPASTSSSAWVSASASASRQGGGGKLGARKHLPRMVMLVGLPGAGKSTFAEALAKADSAWVRVSQDEIGSRQGVEEMVGRLGRDRDARIILDRCNVDPADRKHFVDLAMITKGERVVCVYFAAATAEECQQRISQRTGHPTIPYGGGKRAVQGMLKVLKAPTPGEGYFDEILKIGSFEEGDALLHKWGASPPDGVPESGLFKFPRTHHVLNTGGSAVTRDDLVMTSGDLDRFVGSGHVVVAEEKVDGANLGFSLSKDYEVKAQNRSHWVCASSHSQFKGLDKWLDEHSLALCRLLAPEEEVLFGEWCYARHSVPYTRLPGYFIAFDIYNKRSGQFASVDERNRRLEGLEIPIVPTLARKVFGSRDELLALLESRSAYYDGFVEGAYLRVDEVEGAGGSGGGLHNSFRGKLVRPDFIQGIKEHWQSRTVERNGLAWAS